MSESKNPLLARVDTEEEEGIAASRRESFLEIRDDPEPSQPQAEELSAQPGKTATLRRLLSYSMRSKGLLVLGFIGMLVNAAGSVYMPYLCGDIIDTISTHSNLLPQMVRFMALTGLMFVFGGCRGLCFNLLGERVMLDLRKELFAALVQKDIHFYDVNKSGDLTSRLASDISVVQSAASDNLSILARNLLQFMGSLVLLWLISWKMTVLILCMAPIISGCFIYLGKKLKEAKKKYQDKLAHANSLATEIFGNIRTVRAFACEEKECKEFDRRMAEVYSYGRISSIIYGGFIVLMTVMGNGVIMAVLWYGGHLVAINELSIGELTSYVLYAITLSINLTSVTSSVNEFLTASGVMETIFKLMDTPVEIESGLRAAREGQSGEIEFQGVNFEYPDKKDVKIMRGMDLKIRPGESVAIVGPSGVGKSTIISMIERFYDISAGKILVDGVSIREFDLQVLRRSIGLVSQEPVLFSGSLRDNIAYASPESSEASIMEVLVKSNAEEFVMNKSMFPDGLDTVIGERGIKLSGGQKQRIAIARALIKNPRVLIFDEATSALDSISEAQVQASIAKVMELKERTVIMIAHRLSTIKYCDRIVVLGEGRVIEDGSHKDLLELKGAYYKMVRKQLESDDE
ncbi:ABC transporter B family member 1-like [Hippocampus zosterae]|uniref:ABC transporter B family member 1-like n=1 Tax=Hippocampus zosterae TaxID=109293 RepID=UPI00223DA909|nr:ABC transporter B family member 1-like [Hippocampus zosterae]